MVEQMVERPLAVKLIFVYVTLQILASLYFTVLVESNYFALLGILLAVLALYHGLWEMKKEWMYFLVVLLSLGVIFNIFAMITTNLFSGLDALLSLIAIGWLILNRGIFIEPEGKSASKRAFGTKSGLIRRGLILLGIIGILALVFIYPDMNINYILLAVPIWIIFVWFFLPKILGERIK